jgi:hypothetical protein
MGSGFDAEQVVEELQRLAVAPLQVVGDKQDRSSRSKQRPSQGIEQPLPLVVLGKGFRVDEVGKL